MKFPVKIYVGTRGGKTLSIVDENYPNAQEYVDFDVAVKLTRKINELNKRLGL